MLLEGKVGRERLLRENTLRSNVCFLCCGSGEGPRFGFGWRSAPQDAPVGAPHGRPPWKTTALPPIRDTPMLCHSQDPEPPPTPGLGATGPPSLSSQAPGFPCWLQEDATVVAPSPPLKLLACKMGIPAAGGPK